MVRRLNAAMTYVNRGLIIIGSQRTSLTRDTNNARRPFVQHYTRVSMLKKCTMDVKHLASTAHMRTKTKSPIHQRNIKSRQVSTTPLCAFTVEAFGKTLADERRWPKTRLKGKRHCRLRELLNRTKINQCISGPAEIR